MNNKDQLKAESLIDTIKRKLSIVTRKQAADELRDIADKLDPQSYAGPERRTQWIRREAV